ncbi:MAG: hypothetical protein WBG37_07065 [Desulfobacterales bacterium]
MRLLVLMALVYFGYRAVNTWLNRHRVGQSGSAPRPGRELEDEMVQDPQCGVYFPRREAVALQHAGKTLYFCSPECRDAFMSDQASG